MKTTCGGPRGVFLFPSLTTTHLVCHRTVINLFIQSVKEIIEEKKTLLPNKRYFVFCSIIVTSALLRDLILVWQQDAFPVGTDVFSGQSSKISAFPLHYQDLSSPPAKRPVLDLAPALAPAHLQMGTGN